MARMSKEKALEIIDKVIRQVENTNFKSVYLTSEITESIRNVGVAISKIFGLNSSQFQEFEKLKGPVLNQDYVSAWEREDNADCIKGFLRSLRTEIETFLEDEKETKEISKSRKFSDKKVFIIHGHDEGTKEKLARFLEKVNLEPIILHEKPNEGKTIIEKFETHSLDVGFAIALLTPDDVGGVNEKDLKPRARQNVILELGCFMGSLGRNKVCMLYAENVEIPSDYEGVLYIPLDKNDKWKSNLAKELETAGFEIDKSKLLKSL